MRYARVALLVVGLLAPIVRAAPPDFSGIDAAVAEAIAKHECPGAVVLVGQRDAIVFEKAYGDRALAPTTRPMTTDTIFDLASLSKSVATATSVMILVDRKQIDLDAPVARYLPEFGNHGKERITVEQLLRHRGGLVPDNSMKDYAGGPREAIAAIMRSAPQTTPGTRFAYTDVGFIVLGELVERVSGKPLDVFAHDEVFVPLNMSHTAYAPAMAWRDRIAPTERRNGAWIVGEVHDPRAFALGGVAGHAGVFSTAEDLSRWVRMLNRGGELDGKRILGAATVKQMLTPTALPDGTGSRGLGVDVDSSYAPAPRGDRFAVGTTFGHTGWTGTSYWSDPVSGAYVIVLSNRVHPDGKGNVGPLRRAVATIAAEQLLGPTATTRPASATAMPATRP